MRAARLIFVASLATVAAALGVGATAAHAASTPMTALLLGSSTVTDTTDSTTESLEQLQAEALGYTVTVVDDTTWAAMTAADFAKYQVIIIGDPDCGDTVDESTVAYANASTWEPVVMNSGGNKVLIGTDPVYHYLAGGAPNANVLVKNGIGYAGAVSGATGLYMDLSCTYDSSSASTPVPILDGLSTHGAGQFTVIGEGSINACATGVNIVASTGPTTGLTDSDLSGWECSVHEAFDKFPSDYTPLALAPTSSGFPSSYCANDVETSTLACGSPYILVSGGGVTVTSNISLSPTSQTLASGASNTATVTATVTSNGSPESGKSVTFTVVSGPNAGQTFMGTTNSNGQVGFTYDDTAGAGTDSIEATFVDDQSNLEEATAAVTWTPKPITVTADAVAATEGQAFASTTVATFTDTDTTLSAGDFTATIDWGDGTSTSAGAITGSAGSFTVTGGHTYAEHGSYTVTVTVQDNATNSNLGTAMATVAEQPLMITADAVGATEGKNFSGQVATFTDGDTAPGAGEYSATIDWGDGTTPTAGTITGSAGSFTVTGSHTYAEHGSYSVTVTVKETDNAATTVSNGSTATVAEQALGVTVDPVNATEGVAFSGQVATFTDGDTAPGAGEYSATIDWGDGTSTSTGTISGSAGSFTVSGAHTYATPGNYTIKVTVQETDNAATAVSNTGGATVAEAPLTLTADAVSATEGAAFSGTVGTFTDTDTAEAASGFTATIDWGDGSSTSAGTVTGSAGSFTISGAHTYAEKGSHTITVTVQETGDATTEVSKTATATVADAALVAAGKGTLTQTSLSFSGALATFTDANSSAPLSDFSATVNWGDSSSTSSGTISGSAGSYGVAGSHTYAAAGTYTVHISITDVDGSTASATTTITITSTSSSNTPPVCTAVVAKPSRLWPPNNKFKLITLSGATDPDGDVLTYSITGVKQDEPVTGPGDQGRGPDAMDGPSAGTVYLRAQRSGTGHGRLYFIAFTVSDGHGLSCSGTATVAVPHSKHQRTVTDTGKRYDSFATTKKSGKKKHKHHKG